MNTLKSVAATLLVLVILGAMACGPGEPPVTQIVVEVTSTPEPTAAADLHAATDLHPIADSHAVPNVDASPDADRNSSSHRDAQALAKTYANRNTDSAS